jgi:hypothetical protein
VHVQVRHTAETSIGTISTGTGCQSLYWTGKQTSEGSSAPSESRQYSVLLEEAVGCLTYSAWHFAGSIGFLTG